MIIYKLSKRNAVVSLYSSYIKIFLPITCIFDCPLQTSKSCRAFEMPCVGMWRTLAQLLWLLLLEDSTGAYRSIIYKGTGNAHRTPSLWLLPHSRQLTFQLTTTRAHEDFGVSTGTLPLCSWTHIAYHFLLPPPIQAYPYCRTLDILQ